MRAGRRAFSTRLLGSRVNDRESSVRSRMPTKRNERNLLPLDSKFLLRLSDNREIRHFSERDLTVHLGSRAYVGKRRRWPTQKLKSDNEIFFRHTGEWTLYAARPPHSKQLSGKGNFCRGGKNSVCVLDGSRCGQAEV